MDEKKINRKNKKNAEPMSRDEARSAEKSKRIRAAKRKRFVLFAALFVCVLGIGIALSLTAFFGIDSLVISGSSIYGQQEIAEASGVLLNDNMFLTNTSAVAEKIENTLPYAGTVTVKRKLPASLVIEITDTFECAAFDSEQGYVLINEKGKVLSNTANVYKDGVAFISGAVVTDAQLCSEIVLETPEQLTDILAILEAVKAAELEGITEINMSNISSLTMLYNDRVTIKAGGMANIDKKLLRAKESLLAEDARNPSVVGSLDLTIDPYAYFREGKETSEPATIPVP